MANVIYNAFKGRIGLIDWVNDATIKVALVTSTYVPDIDAHVFFSDITNEVVGTGYTAGGALLAGKAITIDNTANVAKYDATDLTIPTTTLTARGAVIYQDTGTPTTASLIAYIDFVTDKTTVVGDFIISWNIDGVFKIG